MLTVRELAIRPQTTKRALAGSCGDFADVITIRAVDHHLAGRNLFTAKVVNTVKSSKTIPCATANGGSFCVGAIALSDGTFSNDCTTKTKTLKYNAMHAAITKVFLQVRCRRYRVTTAMANTPNEMIPSLIAGVAELNGKRNTVGLVNPVITRKTAVKRSNLWLVRNP